jgi:hypothetical protein
MGKITNPRFGKIVRNHCQMKRYEWALFLWLHFIVCAVHKITHRLSGVNLVAGIACEPCSKGGKSSLTGKLARGIFGVFTYGLSEVARAGYRSIAKKCPYCEGTSLVNIN